MTPGDGTTIGKCPSAYGNNKCLSTGECNVCGSISGFAEGCEIHSAAPVCDADSKTVIIEDSATAKVANCAPCKKSGNLFDNCCHIFLKSRLNNKISINVAPYFQNFLSSILKMDSLEGMAQQLENVRVVMPITSASQQDVATSVPPLQRLLKDVIYIQILLFVMLILILLKLKIRPLQKRRNVYLAKSLVRVLIHDVSYVSHQDKTDNRNNCFKYR